MILNAEFKPEKQIVLDAKTKPALLDVTQFLQRSH